MPQMVLINDGQFEVAEPFGSVAKQQETIKSAIRSAIGSNQPLVIHFHGGLVNRLNGINIAIKLHPYFEESGGIPLFFVWQTGFLETIKTNYKDAFKGRLAQWAIRKLTDRVKSKLSEKFDGDIFRGGAVSSDDEFTNLDLQRLKMDIEQSAAFNSIVNDLSSAASNSLGHDVPEDANVFRSAISGNTGGK